MANKKECLLYTLNGTKEAYGYETGDKACIQAKDGSFAIPVSLSIFRGKFEDAAISKYKPTFYAC